MKRLRIVCAKCGGTDVRRNADTAWSEPDQRWELVALFDSVTCEDCGGECSLKEIELSETDEIGAN